MKAYFIKDLRELWKVGCVILVSFIATIVISHYVGLRYDLDNMIMGYFPIMTCAGGMLLGIVGGVAERIGKRWDFMAHRPASMEAIFWGKTLAGCSLLAIATLAPAMGDMVYWIHYAPTVVGMDSSTFHYPVSWEHARSMIPDLLVGFAFLYSGMSAVFLGLGPRPLFIMSTPLLTMLLSFTAGSFMAACIFAAAGLAIAILAARSLFRVCGQPRLKSGTGVFGVGAGMVFSILILGMMAFGIIQFYFFNFSEDAGNNAVLVTDEGDLVVYGKSSSVKGGGEKTVRLDGQSLDNFNVSEAFNKINNDGSRVISGFLKHQSFDRRFYRLNSDSFFCGEVFEAGKFNMFYSGSRNLFILRESSSLRDAGTLGANGFVPLDKGEAQPLDELKDFRKRGQDLFVLTEKVFMSIHKDDLTVRTLVKTREGEDFVSLGFNKPNDSPQGEKTGDFAPPLLLTNRRVCWLDKNFNIIHEEALKPAEAGNHLEVYYISMHKQWIVAQFPDWNVVPDHKPEIHYARLNEKLEPIERATVPYPNYEMNLPSDMRFPYLIIPKKARAMGLGIPWYCYCFENLNNLDYLMFLYVRDFSLSLLFVNVPSALWVYSILGSLLAGAMAGLVLAPIYALSPGQRLGWTLASLILSWPGVLTMLLMVEKPAKQVCASCGKKRPVNWETCPHCSKPWPAAKTDQTEIFVEAARV
jgi:hypothetical protein